MSDRGRSGERRGSGKGWMKNPLSLTGKSVVVTGASAGIGRATAILLSELGARVTLVGRNRGRLEETLNKLNGDGHSVQPFDLAEIDSIRSEERRVGKECR